MTVSSTQQGFFVDITASAKPSYKSANNCVVVTLRKGRSQAETTAGFNAISENAITRAAKRGDVTPEFGQTLVLHDVPGTKTDRLLVTGVQSAGQIAANDYRKVCESVATSLAGTGTTTAIVHLVGETSVQDKSAAWQVQQLAQALALSQYRFTLHPRNKPVPGPALKKCVIVVEKKHLKQAERAISIGVATAKGIAAARDLGNLAGNICTPKYLATEARKLARQHPALKTSILGEARMQKLGMGAFLSVSRGSRQEAQLICMEYRNPGNKSKPVVLLGKGVTFDTGGISIKPSAAMDEMKFDMCGAASVFGAMQALIDIEPDCNVIGVVAAAENMPDGDASKPGDVVTTMSGLSVEVLNTDAEGRLVLCDALTYVAKYKPAVVIDIATLTGACVVALGKVTSAVMSNNQPLADKLVTAGQSSGDLTWQLPLWDDYQKQLDSNFADVANIGGSPAGAITAGCFLSRFANDYQWAHLDIAGVAWHGGDNKGATGRPVALLVQYILDNHG